MSTSAIQKDTVVKVHYRGTLSKNGAVFDHSEGREPLEFMVGHQQMIPGFEAALIGKSAGEKVKFNLPPEEAYGERDPKGVHVLPLDQAPEGLEVGDQVSLQAPNGQIIPLRVIEKDSENITLDMNHMLAGEELTFEVEVLEVREASAEEIAQGLSMSQLAAQESDCCSSGTCSG